MRRFSFSSLLILFVLFPCVGMSGASESTVRPLLVGYFPQWGIYNDPQYFVKDLITSGSAPLLDQLNYAQGFIVNAHCAVADPNADLNLTYTTINSVNGLADNPLSPLRGSFHQLQELKKLYPRMKILISLEGKASSFADAAQPEKRAAFVASCVDMFVRGHFAAGIEAPGVFEKFLRDFMGCDHGRPHGMTRSRQHARDGAAPGARLPDP